MADTMQVPVGTEVTCRDGVCGELRQVIINPVARTITHLVVEPKHLLGSGRLVPLALVEVNRDEIRLMCSLDGFEKLEAAEETQYLPAVNAGLGYGHDQALGLPYYGLGSFGGLGLSPGADAGSLEAVVYDRVPTGEIDVRRGEAAHASDRSIGKVQGIVIDPRDNQMTHVLFQESHLRGKKEVAIPISTVTDVKDGIHLSLTKDEVRDLPEIDLDHPVAMSKAP
jgi:sporulation protein YlmC with PRC-barrel domain